MLKELPLVAGILLSFLIWTNVLSISVFYPIICFGVWIIFTYISVHNKNKLRSTPMPVYLAH